MYLFLNPNKFVSINMLKNPLLDQDALILFAAKVADRINGKDGMAIKTNPASDANNQ